jgi:hypothetical protein
MQLEEVLDVERFTKSVTPPDKFLFQSWSSTAFEISPEKHRDIARLRQIYMEISEAELKPRHIILFVEALLQELASDEQRKALIRAEALQFRRFELPAD